MNQTDKINYSDWLGATASSLCAIHCTLTPLVLAAKPVLDSTMGTHHGGHEFWPLLDYLFLVLSLAAVWYSSRYTNHKTIKWVLWGAWVVFAIGLLSESYEFPYGKWFMYTGSITLVVAHLQNHRYCKRHKRKNATDNSI